MVCGRIRKNTNPEHRQTLPGGQEGVALLVSVIALSIFSMVGVYMALNATTEVRMADNHESMIEARTAAQAGINHARAVLPGLEFNDLLKGPDGMNLTTADYLNHARTYSFRNPLTWAAARAANIANPASAVAGISDDGLISTGKSGSVNGTILIPLTGIAQTAPNPYGSGTIITSRYFVKVTDNNAEASEMSADPSQDPFNDRDGTVLVRSMGIAQTIRERGVTVRANSVAVFEARFQILKMFNLDAPLVIQGNQILPAAPNMFDGNAFTIDGRAANALGIATIDTDLATGVPLPNQIGSYLAPNQRNNIKGVGATNPSIGDITRSIQADQDKRNLLDPNYMWEFLRYQLPSMADNYYSGNQSWSGGSAPDLGYYNLSLPPNHDSQRPKITFVDGDLRVQGNMSGGGVLVVTGSFTGGGTFNFNGLVLCIGKGDVNLGGLNLGVNGGVYMVNLTNPTGTGAVFGTPTLNMSGNSDIIINSAALNMGNNMISLRQTGWREITQGMDP